MAESKLRRIADLRPHSFVYFDNNSSHFTSISAGGYKDIDFNIYSIGMPSGGTFIGTTVLCDRNSNIVVGIVSSNNGNYTFRFYNPSNSAQTIRGLVMIGIYLLGGVTKGLQLRARCSGVRHECEQAEEKTGRESGYRGSEYFLCKRRNGDGQIDTTFKRRLFEAGSAVCWDGKIWKQILHSRISLQFRRETLWKPCVSGHFQRRRNLQSKRRYDIQSDIVMHGRRVTA